jgi:hypothetical protein
MRHAWSIPSLYSRDRASALRHVAQAGRLEIDRIHFKAMPKAHSLPLYRSEAGLHDEAQRGWATEGLSLQRQLPEARSEVQSTLLGEDIW